MKKQREFEKNSIVLFALMMVANVCSYLFQIVVGNLMTVEQYAQVNTVMSLVGVLSIPTTIITMIAARYIALSMAEGSESRVAGVVVLMLKVAAVAGVVLAIGVFIFQKKITSLFTLDSGYYVVGALGITIIYLFYAVTAGTLQGLKRFVPYGVQNIVVMGGKLLFSVALILVGWKVFGVIAANAISMALALVYGLGCMGRCGIHVWEAGSAGIERKEFSSYAVGTVIAQGCVIALTNGDVLLVKAYFDDTVSGLYSSAAVIAKIALYVSSAVAAALFPMVVELHQKGERTGKLLGKAMLYGGGTAVLGAAALIALRRPVIDILFAERYAEAVSLLPAACLYAVGLAFVTLLMNYLLAVGRGRMFGAVMVLALALVIVLSRWHHDTVVQLMTMAGGVLLAAAVVNILYLGVGKHVRGRKS